MKLFFYIALILITQNQMYSQIKNYYFGLNYGINKEFINFSTNGSNYFDCQSGCWSESDNFFINNGNTTVYFGVKNNNNWNAELALTRLFLHRSAEQYTPDLIGPSGSLVNSGYIGMRPQLRWAFGLGKQIDLGKNFTYTPQIQFSYMYVENNIDTIYKIEELFELFKYTELEKNLSENQIFIGIRNKFNYFINYKWNLTASIEYNQGIMENYYIKQEIILKNDPMTSFYGDKSSKLSHALVSIGMEYIIN